MFVLAGFGVSDAGILSCKTIKNVLYRVSQKYLYAFSREYYLHIDIHGHYYRGGGARPQCVLHITDGSDGEISAIKAN
jgi:RNA 3'-terminal phosphate cyclase